jgi:hypothetical protein
VATAEFGASASPATCRGSRWPTGCVLVGFEGADDSGAHGAAADASVLDVRGAGRGDRDRRERPSLLGHAVTVASELHGRVGYMSQSCYRATTASAAQPYEPVEPPHANGRIRYGLQRRDRHRPRLRAGRPAIRLHWTRGLRRRRVTRVRWRAATKREGTMTPDAPATGRGRSAVRAPPDWPCRKA